ncbi:MAG: tetratricopeptide repeat protein [Nitrospirae bacterium]|nr:MAG: tetratricopeptide repeat protein [Nitrospirota bacterium]
MAESASRAFMTEAKELADAGQFGKAIEVLQQGLKKFPKMVSARVLLGEIYWTSGDASLARAELEQVIKTTPDNFAAHRKLALIYRDVGDRHAAAKACEAVLQANPKDREMKDLLNELLGESKEEKPKADAKKAPAKEEAKATKTTLRLSESPVADPPRAVANEEETLVLEVPQMPAAGAEAEETDSETLAELYITQGHRDKGLEVYRRLVEKDPDNMKLHERIMALEEGASPSETPAQASRKARIRRLEGWLSVIRERRRS